MKNNIRLRLLSIIGLFILSCSGYAQDLNAAIKLSNSEQFEAAGQAFKQLIQKEPINGDNYFYYGEDLLKEYFTDSASSDFKEYMNKAKEQFKKGTEVDPANPLNYIGLGRISLWTGDMTDAKAQFTKTLSLLPKRPQKKGPITAERYSLVLIKIASAYIQAPVVDTSQTFQYIRKAADLTPDNPEVYITMGDAFLEINDGSNAISNYKKAQSIDPKSPKATLRIGQLWMRAKNYNDALAYYREAISVDSTFAPAYRELGDLFSLARMYPDAVRTYKKFLNISPNNITAKVRYAQNLFKAREYQQAVNEIIDVYKEDSTSFNILNRVAAYSYFEINQPEKALKFIEKFYANARPDKIIVSDWVYYGRILVKNKMDSLGIEKFKVAYKMDTTNLDVLTYIAQSYNTLKKFNEAATYYGQKITNGSTNPNDILSMGKAYYNGQNWKMADTSFALYIQNQPLNLQGYLWRARTNVNFDLESKEGTAKPHYEALIQKAQADSVKNKGELLEAYSYLGYFYLKQYNMKKKLQDKENSILYCEKVLAINPNDEKSREIIKALKKVK